MPGIIINNRAYLPVVFAPVNAYLLYPALIFTAKI